MRTSAPAWTSTGAQWWAEALGKNGFPAFQKCGRLPDMAKTKPSATMKTTITLPAELWEAVRILAIQERRGFRAVVADALRMYVDKKRGRGSDPRPRATH